MKTFLTLFKHERRELFPSLRLKRKPDIIGGLFSLLISALVVGVFLYMVSAVTKSYVVIRLNQVDDPIARSMELINTLYAVIILALAIIYLEKMRKTLASGDGKKIFLKLPVSPRTLFLSKISALLLWSYVTAIFFILPINAIFYFVLKPSVAFFVNTALVVLFLPIASFFIATVLLIPYTYAVRFLSKHYLLTFICFSALLCGAFFIYSKILDVIRGMFETGSIKFLFNSDFVGFLQTSLKVAYPANLLANVAFGKSANKSLIILGIGAVVAFAVTLIITGFLHKIMLFGTEERAKSGKRRLRPRSPMAALIKKEFITVFRTPKYLFSYFSIAMAMPFMIFCCYTLFETLLVNAVGRSFELPLTLMVILVFGLLTNTFCSTNITRDGTSALKAKIFPLSPSSIILAKVIFCGIVSSLSILLSSAFLWYKASVSLKSTLIAAAIGLVFSFSEILIATKMDLKHARVSGGPAEAEKSSSKTIAKTIVIGLIFSAAISFSSLFLAVFEGSSPSFFGGIVIKSSYSYLVPIAISALYLLFSMLYCFVNLKKAFTKLVR